MDAQVLIAFGDLRLTVAVAGAIFAWLVTGDRSRAAFWWALAFGAALTTVAASKIVYLGWGAEMASLDFKAVSGHAAGATAVVPVALFLLTQSLGRRSQHAALGAGWLTGLAVALALVVHGEHALAEALAGWVVGLLASALTWRVARDPPVRSSQRQAVAAMVMSILLATCMQSVPAGWWMVKTALTLSGARQTHPWNDC